MIQLGPRQRLRGRSAPLEINSRYISCGRFTDCNYAAAAACTHAIFNGIRVIALYEGVFRSDLKAPSGAAVFESLALFSDLALGEAQSGRVVITRKNYEMSYLGKPTSIRKKQRS
ncbi:hypothetical protein EVAR_33097_1 [Eumeta japonica]|uniref:Uncharacterized protein n=1 Tax=Eumeta variegata TaxID=151549 RepID=A0A4C1Y8W6_EUMVA|nr:hypothetical protein EVAR_33097_1 [Eumeta japonica]